MYMKKEEFLAEVTEIYFITNCYEKLFLYLEHGYNLKIIDTQLQVIRSVDDCEIWKNICAENILQYRQEIEDYVEKKCKNLALKFLSLDYDDNKQIDLNLWFNCMSFLAEFSDTPKCFFDFICKFFVLHLESFNGMQFIELRQMLIDGNLLLEAFDFSDAVKIPFDFPVHLIVQIYNAKYCSK